MVFPALQCMKPTPDPQTEEEVADWESDFGIGGHSAGPDRKSTDCIETLFCSVVIEGLSDELGIF